MPALGAAALASIGLISFAAIAQIAPAFFGGLFWRRGNALGATAGLATGLVVWAVMLFIPSISNPDAVANAANALGIEWLGHLLPSGEFTLGVTEITRGALWSLAANAACYVAFSLVRPATPIERLQASAFVSPDMPAMDVPTPTPDPADRYR